MKVLVLLLFIPVYFMSQAQQEPLSSLYWNSYSSINPANSGFDSKHFATVQGRNQWYKLDNNPKTLWVIYDVAISNINSGVGINYRYDEIGNNRENQFMINYNYQLTFSEAHKLGVGLSLGYLQQSFNDNWIANDPNDLAIPGPSSADVLNTSIGALYQLKGFKAGFSIMNLSEPALAHKGPTWDFEYPKYRTYYVMLNYEWEVSESFALIPGLFYRQDITDGLFDINLRAEFKDVYWIGATGRINTDELKLSAMTGLTLWEKLNFGFAYDPDLSRQTPSSGGSYEVFLSLNIK